MKKFISENLFDKTGRLSSNKTRFKWFEGNKYLNQYEQILKLTSFLHEDASLSVRINCIMDDITELPKCLTCGKELQLKRGQRQYLPKFCSDNNSCAQLHSSTQDKIKKTNLKKYGVEHSLSINRDKIKEKYGVENASQLKWVQDKKKKNGLEKYGVLFQQKHLNNIKLLSDIEYLKNTDKAVIMEETGISQSHLSKILNKFNLTSGIKSKSEIEIQDYIASICDTDILMNKRTIIPNAELDLYLPKFNLAIEYNGLYWHTETRIGKQYHLGKTKKCENNNIQLLHIFENEWFDMNKREIWKSIISGKLGKNKTIYARKCIIKSVDTKDVRQFLISNHIQGYAVSSINYGLYYNDELVSLMTFSKSRLNKKYDWELVRFCTLKYHTVVGGASKLFKYFKKHHTGSIISYADLRYSNGGVYHQLGFELSHKSPPNYFYIINWKELQNRINFQKHKLKNKLKIFNESLTEYENMKLNGYDRIWDCGNYVFVHK